MKTSIRFILLAVISILVVSCFTDHKQEVDKLIRQHKYSEAKEYVYENCYGEHYFNELLSWVIEAELDDCYDNNDIRGILEVKKAYRRDVDGIEYLCQKNFVDNADDIIRCGNYDFIFSIFKDWAIKAKDLEMEHIDQSNESKDGSESNYGKDLTDYEYCDYDDIAYGGKDNLDYNLWNGNRHYNFEVNYFNTIVDKVLEVLIEQKDTQNIQQCISYYKPNIAVKSKKVLSSKKVEVGLISKDIETRYPVKYEMELVNTAKDEALKRVAEAGIEL